ncbi:hypothetical protein RHSIM_RhsimUnG0112900 [Rhododendron simsii]|uniref:Ankyrin repeat family protein n=1 Tax=Rhododendron simsii TaxID=118357 RepID=A0A834L4E9_RHOSS|nr:hypothetical protein RHSIM_RhsimUnG0112900 [Rhododendron simsii]
MNKTEEEAKRLYEACLSGSVEALNALLVKDQLILNRVSSAECFSSDTPLHVAASCGHLEFTKALLLRKPKLASELDSRRCTPLHLASTEGHFEIVRELLRVNPETVEYLLGIESVKDHVNDKNQSGSTALDIVEHCPNRDLKTMEIREFLLEAGVHRSNCDVPKPNPELPPESPPRTDQHCCGKTGVIFMRCISWFWTRFKVDRGWLKEQFSTSRTLLASSSDETPISSPLTPVLALERRKFYLNLQKFKQCNVGNKAFKWTMLETRPLNLNSNALMVIHSARANATHDHGLDPDRLLVAEAFVGKGLFLKRVFFHARGRSGIMHKPECRLTVVVREITPEEEAEIAKLKVSNFLKLTKQERRLVPHKLIETTPIWNCKSKATTHG